MSLLELLAGIDWWQLGWVLAGLFFILFLGSIMSARGSHQRGQDVGWHERQHWETDAIVKGKLERP